VCVGTPLKKIHSIVDRQLDRRVCPFAHATKTIEHRGHGRWIDLSNLTEDGQSL
jgi:hypothetical protein